MSVSKEGQQMPDDSKVVGNRKPPRAGMGRPKGSGNKLNVQAKEAIAMAADGLGGFQRLMDWAKEDPKNESVFWSSIYTKLVPLQVNGTHDVSVVDRAELLRRAGEEVRGIFGERATGASLGAGGGGLPH